MKSAAFLLSKQYWHSKRGCLFRSGMILWYSFFNGASVAGGCARVSGLDVKKSGKKRAGPFFVIVSFASNLSVV